LDKTLIIPAPRRRDRCFVKLLTFTETVTVLVLVKVPA
jgi:hypothetical protein